MKRDIRGIIDMALRVRVGQNMIRSETGREIKLQGSDKAGH